MRKSVFFLVLLLPLLVSFSVVAYGSSQIRTVKYIERITFACISGGGACTNVYGVNYSLTVYVEYWVNLTIPSPTGNVLARMVVNDTWVHDRVYLNLLGRNMIGTDSIASRYYVEVTPQDFGYKRSPYLVVDPPIALDFDPRPEEIVNGLFVARAGKPYPYAMSNLNTFTLHYFELYYEPETRMFVGGRVHFIYTEYVKWNGYPIIGGIYDIYAEIYPASGQPPWEIAGGGGQAIATTTTPHSSPSTAPQTTGSTQTVKCECPTNWTPYIAAIIVVAAFFTAALLTCYKQCKT